MSKGQVRSICEDSIVVDNISSIIRPHQFKHPHFTFKVFYLTYLVLCRIPTQTLPWVTTRDLSHYLGSMCLAFYQSFHSFNSQKTYIPWFYRSSSQQWTINIGSKHGNTLFLLDVYRVKGDIGIKTHGWTLLEGLELYMHDMNRQELVFSRADIFQALAQELDDVCGDCWTLVLLKSQRCSFSEQ